MDIRLFFSVLRRPSPADLLYTCNVLYSSFKSVERGGGGGSPRARPLPERCKMR